VNLKESIIDALRKHPEGLTLRDIAEIVGHHRHTITKYVYELIGAQVIYQRDVGAAKLCYLRETYNGPDNKKKAQTQLIALFMLLLLVPATVIVAQNVTNSSTGFEGMAASLSTTVDEPLDDALGDVIQSENSSEIEHDEPEIGELAEEPNDIAGADTNTSNFEEIEQKIEQNLTVSNESNQEDDEEDNTPLVNGTINETNVTAPAEEPPSINETSITQPNATVSDINETNITIPNETAPIKNVTEAGETQNVTEDETPAEEENITEETHELEEPELFVDIVSPEKATRGDTVELFAVVDNTGEAEAGNVQIEWLLPDSLTVTSGDLTYDCGSIAPGYTCTSAITVFAQQDAPLGLSEVKVRVSYA
jgi:uncharacterized repeat protein (TIGR01451 family)